MKMRISLLLAIILLNFSVNAQSLKALLLSQQNESNMPSVVDWSYPSTFYSGTKVSQMTVNYPDNISVGDLLLLISVFDKNVSQTTTTFVGSKIIDLESSAVEPSQNICVYSKVVTNQDLSVDTISVFFDSTTSGTSAIIAISGWDYIADYESYSDVLSSITEVTDSKSEGNDNSLYIYIAVSEDFDYSLPVNVSRWNRSVNVFDGGRWIGL